MKEIYVGCSLIQAPPNFIEKIEQLKTVLRQDYTVLEFLGTVKGNTRDVFTHDIAHVKNCDLMITECTYPSTGLGFEIATAVQAINR